MKHLATTEINVDDGQQPGIRKVGVVNNRKRKTNGNLNTNSTMEVCIIDSKARETCGRRLDGDFSSKIVVFRELAQASRMLSIVGTHGVEEEVKGSPKKRKRFKKGIDDVLEVGSQIVRVQEDK